MGIFVAGQDCQSASWTYGSECLGTLHAAQARSVCLQKKHEVAEVEVDQSYGLSHWGLAGNEGISSLAM